MYVCMYITYVCMYSVCMHVCMYICTYDVCTYVCTYACTYYVETIVFLVAKNVVKKELHWIGGKEVGVELKKPAKPSSSDAVKPPHDGLLYVVMYV